MKLKMEIINVINNLKGVMHIKPIQLDKIKEAEENLNLVFSEEYKEFLTEFGSISWNGIEIVGLGYNAANNEIAETSYLSVINQTRMAREVYPNLENNLYVIENMDINGALILQDEKGNIFEINEYSNKTKMIATSLAEYIKNISKEC